MLDIESSGETRPGRVDTRTGDMSAVVVLRVGVTGEIALESPTRVLRGCLDCGRPVPARCRNGYCSDVCRLRHRKARRAELLERLLPDDPGRAE